MTEKFMLRQATGLALAANAVRPLPGMPASVPVMFAGWLTAELAPHLLAATVADSAVTVIRHGVRDRSTKVGLAAAGLSAVGLGAVIAAGVGAAVEVEGALAAALGADYRVGLPAWTLEPAVQWQRIGYPFRPKRPDVVRLRNVAYAEGGKRFRLDLFHRKDIPTNAPILLNIHGGGWVTSNKDHQALPLMFEMAARGWVCASMNYPLAPKAKWPEQLVAAKRAIAWLRENAGTYGAAPEFVAITGGSSGGHVATMTALTANDPSLQPGFESADTTVSACVPHYAPMDIAGETDIRNVRLRVKSRIMPMVFGRDPDGYRAASPYARAHVDAPPFFVVHGTNDSLIPVAEARAFVDKLRSVSRNPVAYAELRGGQHAFDVFPSIRSAHVVAGVARFLEWARADAGYAGSTTEQLRPANFA
ncbi:alpha/beta hydrolase [Antrihabitans stalactiti]|uniref:Alpha/beta hydrolase n=1 Tax=Antrihabitans stalactiti TaxID=2584121 RepID=A0A848K9C2_9NOCA|nr:alpha/beta hydrolase [Antrihabitans stalactiti]NMN94038.1 alpha/beta hydrolase [Antrihabitans stalactiti]